MELPPEGIVVGRSGLFVANEGEEEVFFVVGVNLDSNFAFACEPADSCIHFFVFQFCDLFQLFEAQYVSLIECVPYLASPGSDCFSVHSFKMN